MKKWLIAFGMAICLACAMLVLARSTDYYAPLGSYEGNWTNNAEEAVGAPDNSVAWDETDNENQLYTYNFADLTMYGTIDNVYFGLRSNFSDAGAGDDELGLKYSVNSGESWQNLDGTVYDGSNVTIQTSQLTTAYYEISASLSWNDLVGIHLGANGILNNVPDNEVSWIDAIWLRVNYSDNDGPNINQMSPENVNWSLASQVIFYYNVTDVLSNITNCSLILNGQLNLTNTTVNESLAQNFTVLHMIDGYYNWSVNCTDDDLGLNENASALREIYIDTHGPVIELESPGEDMEWNSSQIVVFEYNVSDFMTTVESCSLIIDGSVNGSSDSSITEAATINFSSMIENGNYTWSVNCTDANGWESNSTTFNISVDVNHPNVTSVVVPDSVNLIVGSAVRVICNTTVWHNDGIEAIDKVNATLYDQRVGSDNKDDNNNHYTNSSCVQLDAGTFSANYSCGFDVLYYANSASWMCNITAVDTNGYEAWNNESTSVNELFGIALSPSELNYSLLNAGENSTEDINITVTNLGNMEIDITLYGYGVFKQDGLCMNCTTNNIPIEREKYSLSKGLDYSYMMPLSATASQVDTFNLVKQTAAGVNSTKQVYWKMGIPKGVAGNCSGYVVFGAVPS